MLKILIGHGNPLAAKERELIKVAALKNNLIISDLKKTAASQSIGITPLEYRPLSVLEKVFNNTSHLRAAEFDLEHMANFAAPAQRVGYHLVIDGVDGV